MRLGVSYVTARRDAAHLQNVGGRLISALPANWPAVSAAVEPQRHPLAGLGLIALVAPAPAGAQYQATDYGYGYDYGDGGAYGAPGRRVRVCQPWCPYDRTPCDPPSFKIADRRCSLGSGGNR